MLEPFPSSIEFHCNCKWTASQVRTNKQYPGVPIKISQLNNKTSLGFQKKRCYYFCTCLQSSKSDVGIRKDSWDIQTFFAPLKTTQNNTGSVLVVNIKVKHLERYVLLKQCVQCVFWRRWECNSIINFTVSHWKKCIDVILWQLSTIDLPGKKCTVVFFYTCCPSFFALCSLLQI